MLRRSLLTIMLGSFAIFYWTFLALIVDTQQEPLQTQAIFLAVSEAQESLQAGMSSNTKEEEAPSALPDNVNEVANIMSERRKELQKQCAETLTPEEEALPINSKEFLINDEYKLVWCNIFKAASSTWMYNFIIMAGNSDKYYQKSMKTSPVEVTREFYPRPSLEDLERSVTHLNYTSFVIVREPFQRLLSAYRDKMESPKQPYYESLRCAIVANFSSDAHENRGRCTPTFSEFVDYLLEEASLGRPPNEHWAPYYSFCSPCRVNFDYILHFETLPRDEAFLLQAVEGLSRVVSPHNLHSSNTNYETINRDYFSQLTSAQIQGLLAIYQHDFTIFGYSVQKYLEFAQS
ncbi:carbohydrate sulfotransferase 11 isoform X1 [Procambarus clarkii]|uniref:carbohydrate sulfotransferase 11 isoform X1 n=1 Tax=Procambarus clarkii TaxID=6728 RepID=UPI001E67498A|nr:carbohydrate sulfotransferase 11-like isoform X1 [Procambarus clarkii]XP_045599793.1 carbohydrate sulfotransferase 11-like isoform X1 [Procambarus clarkii]XP_045599794.1 carbohydrate sulfotransferase 11-like isoform X1 [Procambarus clarkii]XP_045599795.1 carbohydrate sulfotransferase 11-like isoform X1 [Procambarus clarkii]XP_045599796.1 carbohydrate sulfotransferase 11-like isoform X1 [Procambarus clarkii]XP_045599797.1 carbohydrate sulfotransferase 11-like isoform X1 [Procambarus clarkii]